MQEDLPEGLIDLMREGIPLIVTHWDADGILSATLLLSWLKDLEGSKVLVPPFTYSWDRKFLDNIEIESKDRKYVAVLDLAVPGGTLDLLWTRVKKPVVAIDHHVQNEVPKKPGIVYINPARRGDPAGRWPSAAHVLASIIGYWRDPLLLAASIVGDLGKRALASRVYQDYMVKAKLHPVNDYWIAEDCAELIDSASTMARRDILEALPYRLAHEEEPCKLILEDGILHSLRAQAEAEVEEIVASARPEIVRDDIVVYVLNGFGRHASKIARRLSEANRDKVVVVVYRSLSTGILRAYARTLNPKAPPLVKSAERMRSLGYSAGGKYQAGNNVVAVEAPKGVSEDEVLRDLLESLKLLGVRL